MAFTLPEFNLDCDIYTGPFTTKALRLTVECNLAWGKRVQIFPQIETSPEELSASTVMMLLLPPLTDVRSNIISGVCDLVDVPAGSGRFYGVLGVDDIGKGFDNEHRCASLLQISEFLNATRYPGLFWPIPIP